MTRRPSILLCEFYHETNSFNPNILSIDGFKAIRFAEGRDFYDKCKNLPCCSSKGFIDAVEEAGGTVIPTISMFGCAGGKVSDEAFNLFLEKLNRYMEDCDFDAVFCSLHGATSTVSHDDACGKIISFIRKKVGEEMVIAACFDLHANITERILKNCDIICGYQTYPHIDFYETGLRAGRLGMLKVNGQPIHKNALLLPVITPPAGYTTLNGPFKSVMDIGKDAVSRGKILDYSVFNVQPWMDVKELASCVVVLSDNDDKAGIIAEEMAGMIFEVKEKLFPNLMSIDEIIDLAEKPETRKPVILGDSADSPNSGSLGDSVAHALRLRERNSNLTMCLFVKDEAAVRLAFETGVGNSTLFSIGSAYSPDMPGPFVGKGLIRSLHDGVFTMEGPASRGTHVSIGKTAVINFANIDIMVCETPIESGDPQILRHFGIEPSFYDIVIVKANTSFLVPYGKLGGTICFADTPGVGASNLKRFNWKNIPKGLYPFDLPDSYKPGRAVKYR